ncbi:hypothetical protein SAMN04487881_0709 [Marinobacter sp. es.048]|uniref:hypothetical protein n=1 Tax=Marinobacter sp. es.048 TaxID=1761795 RepID=UPI000B594520|nr:hypothetical protein [Marinobacter sp. es.048]SNC62668.1 hypothetical protein SAMN04487881_0709 [Marinobacter sp. es.048]
MYEDGFNPRAFKVCAWTGFVFCFLWVFAATYVANGVYILPPSAADSVAKTLGDYTSNLVSIRFAATIMIFTSIFYTTWGMVVSFLPKKVEGDYPLMYYVQVVSLAACVVVVLLIGYFWGVASWRAGETTPEITQLLNDIGWLGVLFTGAPFGLYQIALAVVILNDKSSNPVYPRWSGYFNLFCAFFMFEAALVLFFKTGPFSLNGLFVFYIPMVVFFFWIALFSVLAIRAVNAEVQLRERKKKYQESNDASNSISAA